MDDLADEHAGSDLNDATIREKTRDAIEEWRSDLDAVYHGESADAPELIAWADVLEKYAIPQELPEKLIEGCISDLQPKVRYETFQELWEYCYQVASVVGLMTSRIFGVNNPAAEQHAIDLGIAMQLTNILRDVGEDARNNRIYLPLAELRAHGITEEDILAERVTPEFQAFMKEQVARAREYYRSAEKGIPMLQPDSRMTVRLMSRNYGRILEVIEAQEYDVFSRRASVSLPRKLLSIPVLWLQSRSENRISRAAL